MTTIFGKLWKKLYDIAIILAKDDEQSARFDQERRFIFLIIEELQHEMELTVKTIEKRVRASRPKDNNTSLLQDYIKRIEYANDIIYSIEHFVKAILDGCIEFFDRQWENDGDCLKKSEQQKLIFEKYESYFNRTMQKWEGILSKIERLNDELKKFPVQESIKPKLTCFS